MEYSDSEISEKRPSGGVFAPLRVLGCCSNYVPLCLRLNAKYNEAHVVTCSGKTFQVYNTSKLGVVSISNVHEDEIRCLAVNSALIFSGSGRLVQAFCRGRYVSHRYEGHLAPVCALLPLGEHLISVDESSILKVWHIESEELVTELTFDVQTFTITALVHPRTYVNKVLIGSRQGEMQLWNLRTTKLLFTFYGWGHEVTSLEQAPAINVVAVGLSSGDIYLHDIKFDVTVIKFNQEWGPVTSICFRTDGEPMMTTGSPLGHIAVWHLEKRRLVGQMCEAHRNAVTGMKFIPSQPLLVTSSSDNSVKMWIFDKADGSARILRERSGHSAPPTKIQFIGSTGHQIISAGQDSTLRLFSTHHERSNKIFGRAGNKNHQSVMSPIVSFASAFSRAEDWDCVVACHRAGRMVTTWNLSALRMGQHKLKHPRFKENEHHMTYAQCCAVTSCGNFFIVGYTSGHVDMYNLQSGIYRGSFGDVTAHTGSVRGVDVDSLNQIVVSAGCDALVKLWRFRQKTHMKTLEMNGPISCTKLHPDSCLLAVVIDDFRVYLIDVAACNVIRTFFGHVNRITDLAFSSDSRWLVTSSMDCTIRTWDIPTGRLVDAFLVDDACTSLSLSTNAEYLATSHVNGSGVCLWLNRSLYKNKDLLPLPSGDQPKLVAMPSVVGRLQDRAVELRKIDAQPPEELTPAVTTLEQISDGLLTLSMLPKSRWLNLPSLDLIRKRNKPKEPRTAPRAVPFFIPSVPGLEPKYDAMPTDKVVKLDGRAVAPFHSLSLFDAVDKAESELEYELILRRFKMMGPSEVDTEMRYLAESSRAKRNFLKFIHYILSTRKDFQLAQSYLSLFIKIYGDEMPTSGMYELLSTLCIEQTLVWSHLQDKINHSLCLAIFLKSAIV